jgi:hypothetical protein
MSLLGASRTITEAVLERAEPHLTCARYHLTRHGFWGIIRTYGAGNWNDPVAYGAPQSILAMAGHKSAGRSAVR